MKIHLLAYTYLHCVSYTEETLLKSVCVFCIIINLFLFELSVDAGVAGIDLIEENVELQ